MSLGSNLGSKTRPSRREPASRTPNKHGPVSPTRKARKQAGFITVRLGRRNPLGVQFHRGSSRIAGAQRLDVSLLRFLKATVLQSRDREGASLLVERLLVDRTPEIHESDVPLSGGSTLYDLGRAGHRLASALDRANEPARGTGALVQGPCVRKLRAKRLLARAPSATRNPRRRAPRAPLYRRER
jgi:hypothetical protein